MDVILIRYNNHCNKLRFESDRESQEEPDLKPLMSRLFKFTLATTIAVTGVVVSNSLKPVKAEAAGVIAKVNYVPGYGIAVWNNINGGHTTGQYLPHGSRWVVVKTSYDKQGRLWYDLGHNHWVLASYTVSDSTPVSQSASANTSVKASAQAIINFALKQQGKPYVYGAAGPSAFDCSGLTSYVYKQVTGRYIGRTTYNQLNAGTRVRVSQLQPGDLVFWGNYHVGIYIGNGQYIHSPQPGQSVTVANISSYYYPSYGVRVL